MNPQILTSLRKILRILGTLAALLGVFTFIVAATTAGKPWAITDALVGLASVAFGALLILCAELTAVLSDIHKFLKQSSRDIEGIHTTLQRVYPTKEPEKKIEHAE